MPYTKMRYASDMAARSIRSSSGPPSQEALRTDMVAGLVSVAAL